MERSSTKDWESALGQRFGVALVGLALTYSASPCAAETTNPSTTAGKSGGREVPLNLEPAIAPPAYNSTLRTLGRSYTDDVAPEMLNHPQFITDDLEILRAGVGMDMSLSDIGNFHINLYSPDGDLQKGKRWTLGSPEGQAPVVSEKIWSVGGTLEMTRRNPNEAKTLGFAPQLMFNFDDVYRPGDKLQLIVQYEPDAPKLIFNMNNMGWVGDKVQVTAEYDYWRGSGSSDDTDHPIPQLHVKWSF